MGEERTAIRLVLLGPPGAGKGTQSDRIAEHYHIPHISTGDLFRTHLRAGSSLGKTAQGYMNEGRLVPDGVTEAMVWERLAESDAQAGYVLDGFPRNLAQAEHFDQDPSRRLDRVIHLVADEALLLDRLTGRWTCPKCQASYHLRFHAPRQAGICDACGTRLTERADDRAEAVERRLRVYFAETEPLVGYYRERGLLVAVDGSRSVEEVTEAVLKALEVADD